MNKKEYKLLFESWNKLLKEDGYDLNINIDNYEKEKIINFVWTAIQTLDPTPISGIPDLYYSIKDFKNNKSIENALLCIWNGVSLIPGLKYIKSINKLKDLNKAGKLTKKSTVNIKNKSKKVFELIKDGQDILEGIINLKDIEEKEFKRAQLQKNKLIKQKEKIEKSLKDLQYLPVIDDSNYKKRLRKRSRPHIH